MKQKNIKLNLIRLVSMILIVELIGSASALFAGNIRQNYLNLNLPPLAPPANIFGIVWPILYLLIGIAGYLILFKSYMRKDKVLCTVLYSLQLILNFIWSIIFFNGNQYWWGVLIIIVLDLIVVASIIIFNNIDKWLSLLFMPYLVWLIFATYLALGVAILN